MKGHSIGAVVLLACLCWSFGLLGNDEKPEADITFEKTSHNFGQFPQSEPEQQCTFTFWNSGSAPLALSQVITTCGCTVPEYSKEQIAPGDSGIIKITYNGLKGYPGYFTKVITVRSNAKHKLVRLVIEGTMTE